jgi:hypothetical protein
MPSSLTSPVPVDGSAPVTTEHAWAGPDEVTADGHTPMIVSGESAELGENHQIG